MSKIESLTVGEWEGFERRDFTYNGHNCILVLPKNQHKGNPWVWRAEFFGAFPSSDLALLDEGWCVAAYQISDMFGCPESVELMKSFHDFMVEEFNLNKKADIFGFSRGGLYATNYTVKYPQDISTLYLDAPVLDVFSWPGGFGKGCGSEIDWKKCLDWYKLNNDTKDQFNDKALDKIPQLIKNNTPVMLVAGGADEVVPYDENGIYLQKAYEHANAKIKVIIKPECAHHPHSLDDPTPIVQFIKENFEA